MKKVLLFSLVFLFTALGVYAYETIIIKFPQNELWVKGYYKKIGGEAILQYIPNKESHTNWNRSVVIHSYNDSFYPINVFLNNSRARLMKVNPTGQYRTYKKDENDAIMGRCTEKFYNIEPQCELFRVTRGYEGTVTIHYINKDKEDFIKNFAQWYNIIKTAKMYNSYYRDERTFDKSEYFEL